MSTPNSDDYSWKLPLTDNTKLWTLLWIALIEISAFLRQYATKEIQTSSTTPVPESILCTNAHMWVQIKKFRLRESTSCNAQSSLFTVREMPPTHPGNTTKALLEHWFCPVCSFSSAAKNYQEKFLKRIFPWRFRGLLQWHVQFVRQAGYSGGWGQCFAKWGVWSTWKGQVLVLLQNLLCNKSAATDFAASSPLRVQAAWKNWTCYTSVQNQRRKLNSTQRRIFSGCTNSDFTRKEARLPEQHTKTWATKKLREEKGKHRIIFITFSLCTGNWISSKPV